MIFPQKWLCWRDEAPKQSLKSFVHYVSEASSQARQLWGLSADIQPETTPPAGHKPHGPGLTLAALTTESGQLGGQPHWASASPSARWRQRHLIQSISVKANAMAAMAAQGSALPLGLMKAPFKKSHIIISSFLFLKRRPDPLYLLSLVICLEPFASLLLRSTCSCLYLLPPSPITSPTWMELSLGKEH